MPIKTIRKWIFRLRLDTEIFAKSIDILVYKKPIGLNLSMKLGNNKEHL
jgi:hypothetical protein